MRPRPQYGEYATPEEQRARIKVPDASAALSSGEAPRTASEDHAPSHPTPRSVPTGQRSTADRVLTIGLLGFGLFNVVTGIPAYLDYSTFADAFVRAAGIDATFTAVETGRLWGLVAAILFAVVWFATAALSYLQLRRGRLAFWIPLVGAVVAGVAVGICLAIPLLSDPGILDALMAGPSPAPSSSTTP